MLAVNHCTKLSWGDNLYRIGVLGDGSCFFHAILTAVEPEYHSLDVAQKTVAVANYRRKVADNLTLTHFIMNNYSGIPVYRDLPADVRLYQRENYTLTNESIQLLDAELNTIYSTLNLNPDELKIFLSLFLAFREYIANPKQNVGDEIHLLLSTLLNRDIYLTGGINDGMGYVFHDPAQAYKDRVSLILFNVGGVHWETVGKIIPEGLCTTLQADDPVIKMLRDHNKTCWDEMS